MINQNVSLSQSRVQLVKGKYLHYLGIAKIDELSRLVFIKNMYLDTRFIVFISVIDLILVRGKLLVWEGVTELIGMPNKCQALLCYKSFHSIPWYSGFISCNRAVIWQRWILFNKQLCIETTLLIIFKFWRYDVIISVGKPCCSRSQAYIVFPFQVGCKAFIWLIFMRRWAIPTLFFP